MRFALQAALAALPAVAAAQQPAAAQATSPAQAALAEGDRHFLSRDFDGALEAYRRAALAEPTNARTRLQVGFARRAKGQTIEALEEFRSAARFASTGDDVTKGKALFNIALAFEAQRDLDGARAAWNDYASFVDARPQIVGYSSNARTRQRVIDRVQELERTYREVRARIQAREAQAGSR